MTPRVSLRAEKYFDECQSAKKISQDCKIEPFLFTQTRILKKRRFQALKTGIKKKNIYKKINYKAPTKNKSIKKVSHWVLSHRYDI